LDCSTREEKKNGSSRRKKTTSGEIQTDSVGNLNNGGTQRKFMTEKHHPPSLGRGVVAGKGAGDLQVVKSSFLGLGGLGKKERWGGRWEIKGDNKKKKKKGGKGPTQAGLGKRGHYWRNLGLKTLTSCGPDSFRSARGIEPTVEGTSPRFAWTGSRDQI